MSSMCSPALIKIIHTMKLILYSYVVYSNVVRLLSWAYIIVANATTHNNITHTIANKHLSLCHITAQPVKNTQFQSKGPNFYQ